MVNPEPADVLTPDFYDYPWTPIASAEVNDGFVYVAWPDGQQYSAYGWWLREVIVADGGTDPTTREGTVDPAHFSEDLILISAIVDSDGGLRVAFNDGFAGTVHPGWLRHVADGHHRVDAEIPATIIWTANTLTAPPTFDGAAVIDGNAEELHSFLEALAAFGLARLGDVPADHCGHEGLVAVTDRIGVRRLSNFGDRWNVKAEITGNVENSTANTGFRLGPHTDLPTRETPPGFQFLHCVANTVSGGWSRMTDGAAIVAHLRKEEPGILDALSTLKWIFFNRSRDHDHRWRGPMIDHGVAGSPLAIRAFYPVRGFPDPEMSTEDIPRAYRAAQRFHQLAADPRFQIGYPFSSGDLVGFDNRRILHGRDAFETGAGVRHLRGTYIDHDEVYSRLRVLARRIRTGETDAAGEHKEVPTP